MSFLPNPGENRLKRTAASLSWKRTRWKAAQRQQVAAKGERSLRRRCDAVETEGGVMFQDESADAALRPSTGLLASAIARHVHTAGDQ
jgi:hypothetical protein